MIKLIKSCSLSGLEDLVNEFTNKSDIKVDKVQLLTDDHGYIANISYEIIKKEEPEIFWNSYAFSLRPAEGFIGSPKLWREELKPVIDYAISSLFTKSNATTYNSNIIINIPESIYSWVSQWYTENQMAYSPNKYNIVLKKTQDNFPHTLSRITINMMFTLTPVVEESGTEVSFVPVPSNYEAYIDIIK